MRTPVVLLLLLAACAHRAPAETGLASWYAPSLRGHATASGERYRPARLTAASPTLPFGTVVKISRPDDGRSVRVVINDRGPFVPGRIIDVSGAAARRLDLLTVGVATVDVEVVGCRRRYEACRSP